MSDAIGNHVSHWHVSDTHFEACGCAVICPCRKQRGVRAGMRSTGTVPTIVPETRQNSVSKSLRQPTRSISDVEKSEGFTRKIEDVREADVRLANRRTGRFHAVSNIQFRRIDAGRHFIEGAATARLYWKSP